MPSLSEDLAGFLRLLKSGPRSAETRERALQLSWSFERAGQAAQGEKILRAALAASPEDAELRRGLVKLLERAGRAQEAVEVFLEGGGASPRSRLEAARLLINKGSFEDAEAVLRSGRFEAGDFEAEFEWARLFRWQRRLGEAAQAYRRALRARPQRVETCLMLAETLLYDGKLAEMFAVLKEAQALPEPPEADLPAWLRRFRLAVCSLDYAAAARIGEAVLERTRRTEDLEWLCWQVFTDEFDFVPRPAAYVRQALEALDRFAAERPDLPWGFYYRGLMSELEGRPSSVQDFEAVGRFPAERYGWMFFKTAEARLRRLDYAGAARAFADVARASEPGSWKAQDRLCECLMFLGEFEKAAAEARRLESLAPAREAAGGDYGECLAAEGKLLLWLGDYEGALACLDRALGHTAYDAPCWKGGALVKLGRHEEALRTLEPALRFEFTPTAAEARLWKVEALYRLGRLEEARAAAGALGPAPGASDIFGAALRGLVRGALGEREGVKEEYARLPAWLRQGRDEASAFEAVLERSRGLRSEAASGIHLRPEGRP